MRLFSKTTTEERKQDKAQVAGLGRDVLGLVFVIIIIVLGALIIQGFQDNIADNTSAAFNATTDGLSAMTTVSGFMTTLGLVVVIGLILFVVLRVFGGLGRGGGGF